jgi:hypothetical protein
VPPKNVYKAITRTKEVLITAENESDYVPAYINKSLSYFPVTVLFANEMNMSWHLDNLLQHDFLLKTIPPKNRYSVWGEKPTVTPEQEAVSVYFGYSMDKVKEVISLLSKEQMAIIMKYAENLKEINTS